MQVTYVLYHYNCKFECLNTVHVPRYVGSRALLKVDISSSHYTMQLEQWCSQDEKTILKTHRIRETGQILGAHPQVFRVYNELHILSCTASTTTH